MPHAVLVYSHSVSSTWRSGVRKMSDSEENAAPMTSSKVTDIIDKKGHLTSVVCGDI